MNSSKKTPSPSVKLSKNLMQMKFMKPAVKVKKDEGNMMPNYQYLEGLKFGRFSFKGMNNDIEQMQK